MNAKPYTKICAIKDCKNLNVKGDYCVRHWILNKSDKPISKFQKYPWHKLYYTNTWKRLRIKHLASHPLCNSCGAPAKEVDHIIDHKGNRDLFFDLDNLQTLCKECHGAKTMETIRINNFPKSNEVIIINIKKDKSDFTSLGNLMGNNVNKNYLARMIVRSGYDKKTFNVSNIEEQYAIEKSYKLLSKTNPEFKIIQRR